MAEFNSSILNPIFIHPCSYLKKRKIKFGGSNCVLKHETFQMRNLYKIPCTFQVLRLQTWIAFFLVVFVQCVFIAVTLQLLYFKQDFNLKSVISASAATVYQSLLQRGTYKCADSSSFVTGRAIMWILNAFSFFMFASYTALLTSFMTLRSGPEPIKSFQDIYENDHHLVVTRASSHHNFLATKPHDSYARKLYEERMLGNSDNFVPNIFALDDLLEKIPHALFWGGQGSRFSLKKAHMLESIESVFEESLYEYFAIGMQKDSEYLALFNYYLSKMEESGLLRKLQLKWLPEKRKQFDITHEKESYALGIHEILTLVVALIGGVVLSLCILFIECVLHKLKPDSHGSYLFE